MAESNAEDKCLKVMKIISQKFVVKNFDPMSYFQYAKHGVYLASPEV